MFEIVRQSLGPDQIKKILLNTDLEINPIPNHSYTSPHTHTHIHSKLFANFLNFGFVFVNWSCFI